jgi:hypothetical protein
VDKKEKVKIEKIVFHGVGQVPENKLNRAMKKTNDKHWKNFFLTKKFQEELYEKDGTYREIFDASARSLNLDRLVKTYKDE